MSESREFPLPRPAGTSARRWRSRAGSTICASPARSFSRILRDGTGIMQCVAVKSALPEEVFETLKNLTQESSLIVYGQGARGAAGARAATRWMWRASRWCSGFRKRILTRSLPRSTASIS